MSILTSDKAPYIVVVLLSLLGWHVTQLTRDITGTRAVSYDVGISGEQIQVRVRNVSRSLSVVNATFSISCPTEIDCLRPNSGQVTAVPPTFARPTPIQNDGNGYAASVTFAAGGEMMFAARLDPSQPKPSFFFIPDTLRPLDIYIYDANSVMGFLVVNFTNLVAWSFLFFLLVLIIIIAWQPLAAAALALRKRP